MAHYRYTAQTKDGARKTGYLYAADETELHRKLKDKQLFLLTARVEENAYSGRQLKPRVLADFARELSTLTRAGVTLSKAMGIIANREANRPGEKRIYESLMQSLRQGNSLSDAMEGLRGVFPPLMIHMFRAGESGGNMEAAAMKTAQLYDQEHRIRARIRSAVVYPRLLLLLLLGVVWIVCRFILPRFENLLAQMERIPLSTRILMKAGSVITGYWWLLLLILVLLGVLRMGLRRQRAYRYWADRLRLRLPVIGYQQKVIATARFARALSALYSAGIPIVEALSIARRTVGNEYIDAQFTKVIAHVRAGNRLSDSLALADGFVRKLTDSVRVGEETGQLDAMLGATADAFEYDSELAINRLVSYMEPAMLLVIGALIAFVMFAIFSAIYGSMGAISAIQA